MKKKWKNYFCFHHCCERCRQINTYVGINPCDGIFVKSVLPVIIDIDEPQQDIKTTIDIDNPEDIETTIDIGEPEDIETTIDNKKRLIKVKIIGPHTSATQEQVMITIDFILN